MRMTNLIGQAAVALILTVFLYGTVARAEDKSDTLLDVLVRKGVLTQQEADDVRAEWDKEIAEKVARHDKTKVPKWISEMVWSGDFRLRAEYFDYEKNPASGAKIQDDRLRYRFRARLGLETKFQEWATFGLRVATGADDPVSSVQSFQDTFSRKPFNLDLAYVTIQPPQWEWMKLTGGKMKNPIWQTGVHSQLQYDPDVTPEGIAEQFAWKFGGKNQHKLFANFGQFALDEVSGDVNDQYLFDFQVGVETALPRAKLTLAGGYYFTRNLELMAVHKDYQPPGVDTSKLAQSTSPSRGNATRQPGGAGTTLFYLDDFKVLTARGELAWKVRDEPLAVGTPFLLTFSTEYIKNIASAYESAAAGNQTEGFTIQIAFGDARKKGQWLVAYQYKYLEADASWDAISESDFGSGGTDRRGHIFKAVYSLQDWWQLQLAASVTEKISNRPNADNNTRGFRGEDLLRLQLDSNWRF